ncbi:TerB family tellurite resistance protein [Paracoccus cavernae]|uniref:TerB family tellurite resistance protein n=1 Tax=Paracoccus cavernae TaxID=1571207 RepID=A0ABT8D4Z4_9RHOB|nr:TerB family tellurite resistance protein [Paracoccus cavernae]
MFRNLLSRLFSEEATDTKLSTQDAEVAIAALLVRLARADDHYGKAEKTRIDLILANRRNLDPEDAAEQRAAAEMIEAEAPDTVRFTRLIKDRIPLDVRTGVIEALWSVAYADGRRSAHEDSFVRLISGLLGVTDVDSGIARQKVLKDLGINEK